MRGENDDNGEATHKEGIGGRKWGEKQAIENTEAVLCDGGKQRNKIRKRMLIVILKIHE